ncbi:hypothetical protein LCGC14_3151550, partial [marine sediment metagenome]
AVEGLNIEFATQILADGVHLERSAGYHDWMCQVYLSLWRLGRRRGELGLELPDERIARMHAYTLHHTKPNGTGCGFNDAHGRARTDEAGEAALAKTVERHRSLLAEAGLDEAIPRAGLFTTAGQAFYRTGFSPDDLWWAFDASGWGGGHMHLSRLSVEMHAGRRTVLPDPGIFDYEMSNPFAAVGKGTPAHSTMNVDLANQADVDATMLRAIDLPQAVVVQGRYEAGYWPGEYKWRFEAGRGRGFAGTHDRTVIWLKDRAMIVLDALMHDGLAPAYLHWVSDDVPIEWDADEMVLTTDDPEGNVRLQICPIGPGPVAAEIRRGETDPHLGWVARRA